jgi:hypothetical protein
MKAGTPIINMFSASCFERHCIRPVQLSLLTIVMPYRTSRAGVARLQQLTAAIDFYLQQNP